MSKAKMKEFIRVKVSECEDYLSYLYCMWHHCGANLCAYQELMILFSSLWDSLIMTVANLTHRDKPDDNPTINIYRICEIPDDITEICEKIRICRNKIVAHYDKKKIEEAYSDYRTLREDIVKILNCLERIISDDNYEVTKNTITPNAREFERMIKRHIEGDYTI